MGRKEDRQLFHHPDIVHLKIVHDVADDLRIREGANKREPIDAVFFYHRRFFFQPALPEQVHDLETAQLDDEHIRQPINLGLQRHHIFLWYFYLSPCLWEIFIQQTLERRVFLSQLHEIGHDGFEFGVWKEIQIGQDVIYLLCQFEDGSGAGLLEDGPMEGLGDFEESKQTGDFFRSPLVGLLW